MKVVKKGQGPRYVPPGHDEKVSAIKLFNPGNGSPKVDAHITTFAAGAGMDEEIHPASDHILYLLEGQLEVRAGGKVLAVVNVGDAVHIPAGEPHQVVNGSKSSATFYAVTVPPV